MVNDLLLKIELNKYATNGITLKPTKFNKDIFIKLFDKFNLYIRDTDRPSNGKTQKVVVHSFEYIKSNK